MITGLPIKAPTVTHQNRKRLYREKILSDICKERFQGFPTKNDYLRLVELITTSDIECPNPPSAKKSKATIYEWLIENLPAYYCILKSKKS